MSRKLQCRTTIGVSPATTTTARPAGPKLVFIASGLQCAGCGRDLAQAHDGPELKSVTVSALDHLKMFICCTGSCVDHTLASLAGMKARALSAKQTIALLRNNRLAFLVAPSNGSDLKPPTLN